MTSETHVHIHAISRVEAYKKKKKKGTDGEITQFMIKANYLD
jgi:hypothetical protein